MNLVADNKWLVSGTPVNTSLMDLKNQLIFLGLQSVPEMFTVFQQSVLPHANDPNSRARDLHHCPGAPVAGHFLFLMQTIMMRHSHNMKYRNTTTKLMQLPPKSDETVIVPFNKQDKAAYKDLESEALGFYNNFKLTITDGEKLGSSKLKLDRELKKLRIACAGGHIPLEEDGATNEDEEQDKEEGKRKKKAQRFSEFAYTSKLDKLIEKLEAVRDNDPTSKSLVFSQFTSTLDWLQQELPKRGFQFRTLRGDMSMKQRAKALSDFENDPPTTIFLLSVRSGAVGINLTQANRVFILEPMLNPALVRQAIGRVYRLGQKNPVKVTHFVMKDR